MPFVFQLEKSNLLDKKQTLQQDQKQAVSEQKQNVQEQKHEALESKQLQGQTNMDSGKLNSVEQSEKSLENTHRDLQDRIQNNQTDNNESSDMDKYYKLISKNQNKGQPNQQRDKVTFYEVAKFLKEKEDKFTQYISKEFPNMNQIKIFNPGEAFGEIALIAKSRRTGTMVCREDTHLMVLKKEGFEKVMGDYNNSIIKERIKFFRQFEFMKQIPESKLMVLLHETKIEYFARKQVIYKEDDPLNFMYFIKEGEVHISERCLINPQQIQQKLPQDTQTDNQQIQTDQDIFEKYSMKTQYENNKKKRMVVYQQSNNSFFGELEFVEKSLNVRCQQAVCTSMESTIYVVKKDLLSQKTM